MKLEIKEFVEAVQDELLCYEDCEGLAVQWEKEFYRWLKDPKKSKADITAIKGKEYFRIKDEGDVFEIADSYRDACEEKSVKQYWEQF